MQPEKRAGCHSSAVCRNAATLRVSNPSTGESDNFCKLCVSLYAFKTMEIGATIMIERIA